MYFADLSPYRYKLSTPVRSIRNVGWLEPGFEFDRGLLAREFLEKLEWVICSQGQLDVHFNTIRCFHICKFCGAGDPFLIAGGKKAIGMTELLIPELGNSGYLSAPSMIYHYIQDHQYRPPDVFVESIMGLSGEATFNAEETYRNLSGW